MRSCNAIQPLKQISIHCNTFTPMRKEFGKWLMDIAKYITTAVVLTSFFGTVEQKWIIYIGCAFSILLTLGIGLWLIRDKEKN